MPTVAEMVAAAKQRVENLDVEQVAEEVNSGDALLVDIREPSERAEHGSIAGAMEAPRGLLEFWADPASPSHREEFQPERRIILHCAAGARSALAAATLQDLGYKNVAHLEGGFRAWRDHGKPIEG